MNQRNIHLLKQEAKLSLG